MPGAGNDARQHRESCEIDPGRLFGRLARRGSRRPPGGAGSPVGSGENAVRPGLRRTPIEQPPTDEDRGTDGHGHETSGVDFASDLIVRGPAEMLLIQRRLSDLRPRFTDARGLRNCGRRSRLQAEPDRAAGPFRVVGGPRAYSLAGGIRLNYRPIAKKCELAAFTEVDLTSLETAVRRSRH